jgi:hypothetical protein
MTEARAQRITAIEHLVTCYPRFTISKATLNAYADHLESVDPDELEFVLDRLAKTLTFFPSIAEILHAVDPRLIPPPPPRRTGYRFVRGTHGSTYVKDDDGTDELPKWMDPPAA